jgi:hypothetical protein
MATFDEHCQDCERLLGNRHEAVNKWLDELFRFRGPGHRRFRHHREGVLEVEQLFGTDGAKAAVVHLVRDCGRVPDKMDYIAMDSPIIIPDPNSVIMYSVMNEEVAEKFRIRVEEEWKRVLPGTT